MAPPRDSMKADGIELQDVGGEAVQPDVPQGASESEVDALAAKWRREGLTIAFEDLSYQLDVEVNQGDRVTDTLAKAFHLKKRVFKTLQLLGGVTGTIRPGTMTALMGPSGAGKSTLLDVLAGMKSQGTVSGTLAYNGEERPRHFKRLMGYVQQRDTLHPYLTVREMLRYTALMRIPGGPGAAHRRNKRVEEVINELGLGKVRRPPGARVMARRGAARRS